jgi:hypothetical protein
LAGEVRLGLGLGDGDIKGSGYGVSLNVGKFKIENYLSAYIKPQFKSGSFVGYGLLGVSSVNSKGSIDGESQSGSDSGLSYGLGAGLNFGASTVALEYKTLVEIEDFGDLQGFNIAYQYKF